MKKFNKKEYDKHYRETHRGQAKNKKCLDCGKQIWSGSIRCKSCAKKGKRNHFSKDKYSAERNGHWKGGWKSFCIDCGKKIDFNAIRCKSCARKFEYKNPKNHPQWLGGISFEPYSIEFNDNLKEQIRKRDNYICQNCGLTNEEHLIVYDRELTVHHIDYNKENCSKENLISLCVQCNSRANFNRSYWLDFYKNKVLSLIKKG